MKLLKKYILIFPLILLFSCKSIAQENTPDNITSEFFKIYETNSTNKALEYLFLTNKFITPEDVKVLSDRVTQYSNILGEYYGRKLLIKKNIGDLIEVHSFILKYERQPIRFIMTFYKPNNKWKIYNFKISDDFITELESATIELAYKKGE